MTGPDASVLDRAPSADIIGALGPSRQQTLAAAVMAATARHTVDHHGFGSDRDGWGNDAGGVILYAQAGQDYGTMLVWTLVILTPILYLNQEIVIRLGAVSALFPELSATTLETSLVVGAGIGIITSALVGIFQCSARAPASVGPDPIPRRPGPDPEP